MTSWGTCASCSRPTDAAYFFGRTGPLCRTCFALLSGAEKSPKRSLLEKLRAAVPFLWRR